MSFAIHSEPLDPGALAQRLVAPAAGACVTFEGWVRNRNEGRDVLRLEYEAHEALAAKEGAAVIAEALEKFPLTQALCEHRVGMLEIAECAVWVGVSSPHRDEAFRACRYIIDEIKHRLPIWKKEHYADGDSGWVNCQHCGGDEHRSAAPDEGSAESADPAAG